MISESGSESNTMSSPPIKTNKTTKHHIVSTNPEKKKKALKNNDESGHQHHHQQQHQVKQPKKTKETKQNSSNHQLNGGTSDAPQPLKKKTVKTEPKGSKNKTREHQAVGQDKSTKLESQVKTSKQKLLLHDGIGQPKAKRPKSDRSRAKEKKRFEEIKIDGFTIESFKTWEDLQDELNERISASIKRDSIVSANASNCQINGLDDTANTSYSGSSASNIETTNFSFGQQQQGASSSSETFESSKFEHTSGPPPPKTDPVIDLNDEERNHQHDKQRCNSNESRGQANRHTASADKSAPTLNHSAGHNTIPVRMDELEHQSSRQSSNQGISIGHKSEQQDNHNHRHHHHHHHHRRHHDSKHSKSSKSGHESRADGQTRRQDHFVPQPAVDSANIVDFKHTSQQPLHHHNHHHQAHLDRGVHPNDALRFSRMMSESLSQQQPTGSEQNSNYSQVRSSTPTMPSLSQPPQPPPPAPPMHTAHQYLQQYHQIYQQMQHNSTPLPQQPFLQSQTAPQSQPQSLHHLNHPNPYMQSFMNHQQHLQQQHHLPAPPPIAPPQPMPYMSPFTITDTIHTISRQTIIPPPMMQAPQMPPLPPPPVPPSLAGLDQLCASARYGAGMGPAPGHSHLNVLEHHQTYSPSPTERSFMEFARSYANANKISSNYPSFMSQSGLPKSSSSTLSNPFGNLDRMTLKSEHHRGLGQAFGGPSTSGFPGPFPGPATRPSMNGWLPGW